MPGIKEEDLTLSSFYRPDAYSETYQRLFVESSEHSRCPTIAIL